MTCDIVVAGVGGQGVLSLAAIVASSALRDGLQFKQSEVHGMSQRGGDVVAHLRLSSEPIMSDLIPRGRAALVLSMEPLESLRYLDYLSPEGTLLTSTDPVENMTTYPDVNGLLASIRRLPHARLVDARRLAREAGSALATNAVMVGAASDLLPVLPETIEGLLRERFAAKGEPLVAANLEAFRAGRALVRCTPA